ncbi:MAG: radical SAM protein [Desulfobacterales bacterium]
MAEFKIKKLISGGLITNYFCTSRCRHCLYNCSPAWEKEYMTPQAAEENLLIIRRLGCKVVHIGGGEPLLRPAELSAVLEVATAIGVAVDYVETNSSWFKDKDSAVAMLSQLHEKGLQTLLVSISPFHNEFIPFTKVKGVVDAARKTGIGIFPWISDFLRDLSELDETGTHALAEYEALFGHDYIKNLPQRYWIHMGGRALNTLRPYFANRSAEQILKENADNCAAELTDTGHFHLDLFGNYIPGLCSGLSIYREDLNQPLAADKYPVLSTLFSKGIRGIFEMARHTFNYTPAKPVYINKCDLCTEIRTLFAQHNFGGPAELNPKEFYSNL